MVVEAGQRGVGAGQPDQPEVGLDDVDAVDVRIAQHLAQGEPVAAAEDEDARVPAVQRGVDEGLVVAAFVVPADAEPPVQVDVQGPAAGAAGEDDLLDAGALRDADVVAVHGVPCGLFEVVGEERGAGEDAEHGDVGGEQHPAGAPAEVAMEEPQDE
ncbi:hypothetical protein GCM10020256_34820 [Streptomyces thermocoprophilus]